MRVRFTPAGRAQFLDAIAYIRRQSPAAALRRLQRFPNSGRIVPEFPDLPYREVIVRPYRFFYRVKDPVVWIVAVWHGAQLPEDPHV